MNKDTPLKVLIVEDDPITQKVLNQWCHKLPDIEVIGVVSNGVEALNEFGAQPVDVLISDVSMPGLSGLELAQSLYPKPYIILISGSEEFAVEAFTCEVTDFLLKPLSLPRLLQAFERVREDLKRKQEPQILQEHFFIRANRKLIRLELSEVRYLEASGDYVTFNLTQGQYLVHTTLKQVEAQVYHPDWVRVHRSYIVNLSYVLDIEDTTLVIDRKVIPISRSNRPKLLSRIQTLG